MTNGSDPIGTAIDDAACGMTAYAPPDLRLRVAARRERSAPGPAWWQPALAAAALAVILLLVWPPPPRPDQPRAARADIVLAPDAPPPAAALPREPAVRSPARPPRIDSHPEPWPDVEQTIEPLALAALALDPIETVADPLAPVTVAPLEVPLLAMDPLDEHDVERRR